jgi:hypothetical protein
MRNSPLSRDVLITAYNFNKVMEKYSMHFPLGGQEIMENVFIIQLTLAELSVDHNMCMLAIFFLVVYNSKAIHVTGCGRPIGL